MATVNPIDGIKYGFQMLGYLLLVGIAGGVVVLAGGLVSGTSEIIGGIIAFVGVLVIYAGSLGLLYKVIADGVKTGVQEAGVALGGGQGQQYQGGQQYEGGQQYQGGRGQR